MDRRCTGYDVPSMMSRRAFWGRFGMGLGGLALSQMLHAAEPDDLQSAALESVHFPPRARRVIFLFQAGGPSQMELLDYKPLLNQLHGTELPESVRGQQRLTGMTGSQSSLPLAGSAFRFAQHGQSGAWISELLPHTAKIVDQLCIIRSMHTEAINHGPAVTYVQTGSQFPGRPSIGSWLSYGLGTENKNLPAFVVMITRNKGGQPLVSRLWGNGFLPSRHQGVLFRPDKDPVLYLNNPPGIDAVARRSMLDTLAALHLREAEVEPAAEIENRIEQYELAYRMQTSIPEATDTSDEPEYVFEQYGPDARTPGTFAANCLLARRLAERGVRFVQLYHQGWDQHGGLPEAIKTQCRETDQASAALVRDLQSRGMLDDTLVIWAGEFGRTNYCQGKLTANDYGRDHHPRCFSIWMAGGGVRPGIVYGSTDDYGYNINQNPVHLHDLQATLMHLLGIDHERLTFKYQGRRFRLTDVSGTVVQDVLA